MKPKTYDEIMQKHPYMLNLVTIEYIVEEAYHQGMLTGMAEAIEWLKQTEEKKEE